MRWKVFGGWVGRTAVVVEEAWWSLTEIHLAASQWILPVIRRLLHALAAAGHCCKMGGLAPACGVGELVVGSDSSSLWSTLYH